MDKYGNGSMKKNIKNNSTATAWCWVWYFFILFFQSLDKALTFCLFEVFLGFLNLKMFYPIDLCFYYTLLFYYNFFHNDTELNFILKSCLTFELLCYV